MADIMENLVCRNITKQYEKGKYALRNVNLSIPSKGIFALIGRNGAGKTTLVRILATQLALTSGSACIDGIDVTDNPKDIREMIASVPQDGRAVGWLTPRQMIKSYLMWRGFSGSEANSRAEVSLKEVGVYKYIDTLNRLLSGGTRRKVLVAMVMASEAKILFLDEPTTGLDPISRSELWRILVQMKKDRFIFLTTHYLEEAETLADKIGVLEDGKLMALGTLSELRSMVKYPYSIKILSDIRAPHPRNGKVIKGIDRHYQIVTTEKEAYTLTKKLIAKGVKFSMNPLTLDDIFYYIVKKPIEGENYENEEERD